MFFAINNFGNLKSKFYLIFQYDQWRCITASECNNKSYSYNAETINQQKQYKAYNGECIAGCPEETKEKLTKDGLWICEVNKQFSVIA